MAMELDNSFTVPVPPEQAWDVLLDVERIAPCMPGATGDSVEGDVIKGRIKVKVGPVQLTYAGSAHFTERDDQARSITLEASGKETRGAGTARFSTGKPATLSRSMASSSGGLAARGAVAPAPMPLAEALSAGARSAAEPCVSAAPSAR